MRAIHYLHWGCSSINLLLKKKSLLSYKICQNKISLETPSLSSRGFCSTAINSQLSRGVSLSASRARSPRNASEGSVIRFRILNLQASARVPVDSGSPSRFHPWFVCVVDRQSVFFPLVSRRWRQRETQFPSSNRDRASTTKSGFTSLCNGSETVRREHKWGIFQACFSAETQLFYESLLVPRFLPCNSSRRIEFCEVPEYVFRLYVYVSRNVFFPAPSSVRTIVI